MLQRKRRKRAASAGPLRRWRLAAALIGGVAFVAALAGCGVAYLSTYSPPVPADTVSPIPGSPIDHIVIIMQENRTFDNLLDVYKRQGK